MEVEIDDPVNAVLGEIGLFDVQLGHQNVVYGRGYRVVLGVVGRRPRLCRLVLEVARQSEHGREDDDADDAAPHLSTLAGHWGTVRTTQAGVPLESYEYSQVDRQRLDEQRRGINVLTKYRDNRADPTDLQQESVNGRQNKR